MQNEFEQSSQLALKHTAKKAEYKSILAAFSDNDIDKINKLSDEVSNNKLSSTKKQYKK